MKSLSYTSWIWRFTIENKSRVTMTAVCLALFSASSLMFPWMVQSMLDFSEGHSRSAIDVTVVVLVFVASTILGYFAHVLLHGLGIRFRDTLRRALFKSLLAKPIEFIANRQVGELSSRASDSLSRLNQVFPGCFGPAFQNSLLIGGGLLMMSRISLTATIAVLTLIAIPLPFLAAMSRKTQRTMYEAQSAHAREHAVLEESLVAIQDVRAFGLEPRQEEAYLLAEEQARTSELLAIRWHGLLNQGVFFFTSFLLIGIFWGGTGGLWFFGWKLGSLVAFYMYAFIVAMAVVSGGRLYAGYQNLLGSLQHVVELIDEDQEVRPQKAGWQENLVGRVHVDRVSFAYVSGREIFQRFSLTVEPGTWMVITGPSGSGKSTLASMLMGFYSPQSGSIQYDNRPIPDWEIGALRRQMGFVGQRPLLFHGTVRDNITLGRPVSQERLDLTIKVTCLEELVSDWQGGLDSLIKERGVNLSGGQKLRLALARAIAMDPAILILDEPGVMLESDLETILWQRLITDRQRKTTIIFTHHAENIPKVYSRVELQPRTLSTNG